MCLTCGCMDAHKEMDQADITFEDLKAAADEHQQPVQETIDIMAQTLRLDRADHPSEYGATVHAS